MTADPYLRHIERLNGVDDVECPQGHWVPVGEACEVDGWRADGLDDPDRLHDERGEE